ncbi:TPA: ead/Ea22-like family protein [Klebsiella pneumoniae]
MTDITELAQSLKAAAEKATPGEWRRASTQFNGITATPFMLGRKEVMIAGVSEKCDAEFIAMANPANILSLVEALEYYKSREERVTSLVRDNSKSWDELYRQVEAKGKRNVELVDALEKAQQRITELEQKHCGGALMERELAHSEVINKLMSEIDNRDSRIAELESRAVKLPPCVDDVHGIGMVMSADAVVEALTTAGIKVEVE